MTDKEVLQKAIEKAMDNGWMIGVNKAQILIHDAYNNTIQKIRIMGSSSVEIDVQVIIFSHDFAKAFWGEKMEYLELAGQICSDEPIWKYELQKMVLEENPIDYLRKFI